MGMDELRTALEKNPNDLRTFQSALEPILKDGDTAALDDFLDTVSLAVPQPDALGNLLRAADFKAKSIGGDIYAHLSYKVGLIYLNYIKNEDMAEMCFRRLPPESPYAPELHDFYVEFYIRKENWKKLETLFQDEARVAGHDDPVNESRRQAARLATERGNPDRAASYWQALRKELPQDEEAQDRLIEIFQAIGRWPQVADMIKAKADAIPDDMVSDKVELYEQLIPIYRDRMNMEPKVVATYAQILKLQPENEDAFQALCLQHESTGRWPEVVKLLKSRIETTVEKAKLMELHERVGLLALDKMNNPMEAMRSFEAMLELEPTDLKVIGELKRLYEARQDFQKYVDVAMRELELLDESERRAAIYALARLALEKVRDPKVGISLWSQVFADSPDNAEAFDSLSVLYERSKNFEALARLGEERLEWVDDVEKATLLEKLAMIYGARINDNAGAASAWRRLLQYSPDHARARAELKKLLIKERDREGLDWFFRNYGTLQDYSRTLEQLVKEEESPHVKVGLLLSMAELFLEMGGQDDRARRCLENVLEIEPGHVEAGSQLIPIYGRLEKWADLVRVQELVLANKADQTHEEKLTLLLEKALVHETRLNQLDDAFFTFIEAYRMAWQRSAVQEEFKRLAHVSDNWSTYISEVESMLENVSERTARMTWLLHIAQTWEEKLEEADKAIEFFARALELDEYSAHALNALERLYGKTAQWPRLRDILERRVAFESAGSAERQRLLVALGELCFDQLQDAAGAIQAYTTLVQEVPHSPEPYDRLGIVLLKEQRFEELLGVLEARRAALNPVDNELADLLVDIGMLRYGVYEDVDAAVKAYIQAVETAPEHGRAVALLEEMLGYEPMQLKIAQSLEFVYELREDLARLCDVLEIQTRHVDQEEQVSLLERLDELYRRQERIQDATRTIRRLMTRVPERRVLKAELERLTETTDEWIEAVELYQEIADQIGSFDYRLEILRSAGTIFHQRLGDNDKAKEYFGLVLAEDAGDQQSLDALEAIAREEKDWEGLIKICETRRDLALQPELRIDLMFQMAFICRDDIADLRRASQYVEAVLEIDPTHAAALNLLDDLYTVQERWEDLLKALEQMASLAQDPLLLVELQIRMAELLEQKLEQPQGMVARVAEALDLDPDNQRAIEILDRNIKGDVALDVLDLLEAAMRRAQRHERLVELLRMRRGFLEEAYRKVEVQKEIARIFEELMEDKSGAFREYKEALNMDPEDSDTLDHLLTLAIHVGNYEEFFSVLEEQSIVVEGIQQLRMWRLMARLSRDQLQTPATAIEHFRMVLDVEPQDPEAVVSLTDLYRDGEMWDEFIEMLSLHASFASDVDERKTLLAEAGLVLKETLGKPQDAIAKFQEILDLDPNDDEALAYLHILYEETGGFEELEDVLSRRAYRTEDKDERRALLLRRSEVLEHDLERLEDANMVLQELYRYDEADMDVIERLESLHEKREDWLALLQLLAEKEKLCADEELIPVLLKTAAVHNGQMDDVHQAVATYERLLELFPALPEAVDALEAIVQSKDMKEEAYGLLKPILESTGEWERLLVVMESFRQSLDDPARKVALLLEMSHVADEQLGDLERAFLFCSEALASDQSRGYMADRLLDIGRRAGLLEEVVAEYGKLGEAADSMDDQADLFLRKAAVLKDDLRDFQRAIAQYEDLRELSQDPIILASLDELYLAVRNWEKLAAVLQEELMMAASVDDKMVFYYRLADLFEEQLDDPAKACEFIKEAYHVDSANEETLGRMRLLFDNRVADAEAADLLEQHYSRDGLFADVANVLERRFALTEDPADKLEIARRLVTVFLERLEDKPKAHHYTGESLMLDPVDETYQTSLLQLMEETSLFDETVDFMELARAATDDPDAFRRISMETGALLQRLERFDEAEAAYKEVVEKDETHVPAYQALESMYEEQLRFADCEKMLTNLVELAQYDDEKIPLLLKLGRMRRDQLDQPDGAISAFEAVVEADDRNLDALGSLDFLYEMGGHYEKLADILAAQVDLAQEPPQRVELLERLAKVAEDHLGDDARAIQAYRDILDWTPEDALVLAELQRLYATQKEWEAFVEVAERETRLAVTPDERKIDLWRRIAQAARNELEDASLAQTNWEFVRELLPEDPQACAELRTLYRETEFFTKLGDLLDFMARREDLPLDQRVGYYEELAKLRTDDLMDIDGAVAAWRSLLMLDGNHIGAYRALETILSENGRFPEAVEAMAGLLGLIEDEAEQVELLDRIATMQEESMNAWAEAAETRKSILALTPHDLEQYERIEMIYEMHQDWNSLTSILNRRISVETDLAKKVEILTRIAQTHEEKAQDDLAAIQAVILAVELDPLSADLVGMGERIAQRSELWAEIYTIWSRVVEVAEEPEMRREFMMKLGEINRNKLANPEEAVLWYERVVEENPEDEEALTNLVELYEESQDFPMLASRLALLAKVTAEFGKQISYYLRLGEVYKVHLQDPLKAIDAYQVVLENTPDEAAIAALQNLYAETGQDEKLIEVIQIQAQYHPEQDADLKLLCGAIYEERLAQPLAAADLYEELVRYDPTQVEAFDRLERIYKTHEKWDKLAETYERLLSSRSDPAQRLELMRMLAVLHEGALGSKDVAADYYQQILDSRMADDATTLEVTTALERLYEEQERWDELVLVQRRMIDIAETVGEKVGFLLKMASIYTEKLEDISSAIQAYREVLEHDPGHLSTLETLEALFKESGDWLEVLNLLDRRIKVALSPAEAVSYYLQKGDVYRTEMLQPDKAREQFHLALERDRDSQEAVDRLVDLYTEEENWEAIVQILTNQFKVARTEEHRATVLTRMGYYMLKSPERSAEAIEVLEAALSRVPGLVEAQKLLSDEYVRQERWEKAYPLLVMLEASVGEDASPEMLGDLYSKLASCCLFSGQKEQALDYFRRAYDRNPDDLVNLRGLAQINFEHGLYDVAETYYKQLLDKARDTMEVNALIGIYRALGEVEMNLGKAAEAREYLSEVLALQPTDKDSLAEFVRLMELHEDWEEAIRYRRRMLELTNDGDERWQILIDIADTYRQKLENTEMATQVYMETLNTQRNRVASLFKLLEIHTKAKNHTEVVRVIDMMVDAVDDVSRKATYAYLLAEYYRKELDDPVAALPHLERTLDFEPEKLEAFRAIDEILTQQKDWTAQEGAYKRMLKRVSGRDMVAVEFNLYKGLGEIYRTRLRDLEAAAAYYEQAWKINSEDPAVIEILSQLYEVQGQREKALIMLRSLIKNEPDRLESYRTISAMSRQLGKVDDAWFALSVLAMANKLTPPEKEFFDEHRPRGVITPRKPLDFTLWQKFVFSRMESPAVGAVFQIIYEAIGSSLAGKDPKDLGLKKKDEIDLNENAFFNSVFNQVSTILGIPAPHIFLNERSFGMRIENTFPPIIMIGKDMLANKGPQLLAFMIGKHLAFFHPMHILAACYPPNVLKLFYGVATKLVHADAKVDESDSENFQELLDRLQKKLSPQGLASLTKAIDYHYKKGETPSMSRWLAGVELTANHAGLLCCMDLDVAAGVLRQEAMSFSKLPPKDKAKDLVLFAVSEEFSAVREALGIQLPK